MNAGRLEIELLANMARLQSDMAEAKRSVGGAMQGIQSSVEMAKTAFIGLGVAGMAVSFAGTIKGAIDAADQINKLSQRTGLAAEQLSQLQFAAKLSDVSTESLTTGLKKLNISIAEGAAGDKEKIANFKALGITLTDASGKVKTADQVLMDMSDRFSTAKDGAGKTAVAVALLGKAGDEMIPLLNGGSGALMDMMGNANKLGLTISTDFAKQAEEFNDNITIMQTASQKAAIALGSDLVRGLSTAMKAMVDATIEGGKLNGMLVGLQTFLTGDDRHKANVAMVDLAENILQVQNALTKLTAKGEMQTAQDARTVVTLQAKLKALQEEYGMHQRMAQALDVEAAKAAAAKPKQTDEIKPPGRVSTGMSDAERARLKEAAEEERARLKEQADRIAYFRQIEYERGKAVEDANKAYQERQRILAELAAKQYLEYVTAMDRAVMASVDALGAGMAEAAQYGLLKSQITELTVAKLDAARVSALSPQELAAIDAQIANYRQLIDVQRGMEAAQASRQAAQAAADEWRRATDQIEQALTNALMEGGKNGADYITGLFRTMVLRPIISAAINPLAGAVTTAMGVAGPGAALGGGFGLGLQSTMQNGFMNFGANAANIGAMVEGGSYAQALGSASPYIAAAIAAYKFLKSFEGGETRAGGQYSGTNLLAAPSGGQIDAANVTGAIGATQGSINAYLARLGSSTRLSEFFSGLETSDNGKGFAYAGGALSTGAVFGQGQNGLGYLNRRGNFDAAGAVTAFGEELSQAVLQALQMDLDNLPDYVRRYLDGIDVDAMGKDAADKLLASIDAVATQRATLEQQIYELTTSDAQKLIDARIKERATIDATNIAQYERLVALQDEQRATAAATVAAQERARIEEQLANQRQGLQTQLYQLTGNTAALRADVLAALGGDQQSIELQRQIWAMQDAQQAASVSAASYATAVTYAGEAMDNFGDSIAAYLRKLGMGQATALARTSMAGAAQQYQQQLLLAGQGNASARSSLTDYADAYLSAVGSQAGSAMEVTRARAFVNADLSRFVTDPNAGLTASMRQMAAEMAALRSEVVKLRAESQATAINTRRFADDFQRVSQNGEALITEASA